MKHFKYAIGNRSFLIDVTQVVALLRPQNGPGRVMMQGGRVLKIPRGEAMTLETLLINKGCDFRDPGC